MLLAGYTSWAEDAEDVVCRASGWFGQKKEDAKDAAEDSKDYLSRKSQGARDEADHQANKYAAAFLKPMARAEMWQLQGQNGLAPVRQLWTVVDLLAPQTCDRPQCSMRWVQALLQTHRHLLTG